MIFAAAIDAWRWQPHPEVWLIVAAAGLLAWYAVRVIGPHAVAPGEPIVTRKNTVAYVAAIVVLWIASDWPLHDISEEYLYSAHMVQHLLLTMIVPPLLLTGTPEWLARLVISDQGRMGTWTRRMTHPVVAGLVFNVVVALTHLPFVVNTSAANGPFHYLVHLTLFTTALWMWTPVAAPIPEVRISPQAQVVYLFLMSVIPTVPAGFLTFAHGALYDTYDHEVRVWGISVATDQQTAGLIMKLVGGLYLWGWIAARFVHFSSADRGTEAPLVITDGAGDDVVRSHDGVDLGQLDLTYAEVQAAFERSGPAPSETPGGRRPGA